MKESEEKLEMQKVEEDEQLQKENFKIIKNKGKDELNMNIVWSVITSLKRETKSEFKKIIYNDLLTQIRSVIRIL